MQIILILLSALVNSTYCLKLSLRSYGLKEADDSEKIQLELTQCNPGCVCTNQSGLYILCNNCQPNLIYYPDTSDCKISNNCNGSSTVYSGMCCMSFCTVCNYANSQGAQICQGCANGYELLGAICFLRCQSGLYRYPDNICRVCDLKNKQYLDQDNFCQQCHSSCQTCNGFTSTSCLSCPINGTSLFPDNSCQVCNINNKQYINSQNNCKNCDQSCQTCNGPTSFQCLSCPSGTYLYPDNSCRFCDIQNQQFLDNQNICRQCDSTCQTCNGLSPTQCQKCLTGKNFYPDHTCKLCDISNKQYLDNTNICRSCDPSCQTCNGSSNTQCQTCITGKNFYPDHTCRFCDLQNKQYLDSQNICRSCDPTCQTCNGSTPTSCKSCPNGTFLYPDSSCKVCDTNNQYYIDPQQICRSCDPTCQTCNGSTSSNCLSCPSGYFQQGSQCIKCNAACNQCTGPTDQDCKQCNYLFFQVDPTNSKRCVKCPNNSYLNSSNKNCSNCDYQCIPCRSVDNNYSMLQLDSAVSNNQDYCLVCSCRSCKNGYIKFNQKQCTSSCDSIGNNYEYNSSTNSCQCQAGYSYLVKNPYKNNFDCTQGYGFGYYCESNNICFKCIQNCSSCTDQKSCLKCNNGSYLWQNNCFSDCFPNLNIIPNADKGICECPQGYILQKLNPPIDGQTNICLPALVIQEIKIYNYLMQSKGETLPSNFYDNLIVFSYNRNLTSDEYKSINFVIDQGILNFGQDYKILSVSQNGVNVKFIVWSAQNRKAKQFTVTISGQTTNYKINNQILVSEEYGKDSQSQFQSQGLTNSLQSMSSAFSPNGDSFNAIVINLLKQFQVLCYISNFVQVLPIIYLIRDSLPSKIKFACLFGSAIVFNQNPPPSQITFTSEQALSSSNQQQLQTTLKSFGISQNDIFKGKAAYQLDNIHAVKFFVQLYSIFNNSNIILHMLLLDEQ